MRYNSTYMSLKCEFSVKWGYHGLDKPIMNRRHFSLSCGGSNVQDLLPTTTLILLGLNNMHQRFHHELIKTKSMFRDSDTTARSAIRFIKNRQVGGVIWVGKQTILNQIKHLTDIENKQNNTQCSSWGYSRHQDPLTAAPLTTTRLTRNFRLIASSFQQTPRVLGL